jgi:lipoprotein NlpI
MKLFAIVLMLDFVAAVAANQVDDRLGKADEAYRRGEFNQAIAALEPLLEASDGKAIEPRVKALATRVLHARGEDHFRHGRVAASVADFDREVGLQPEREAEHWQRGIAYYYAEEYEKGARQFELHKTVNPQDVENAAWHFLCVVRGPNGSVEAARKRLIEVSRDTRVPMAQVQRMFAGDLSPEDVVRAGEAEGGTAKFYADLYAGLYFEALGRREESLRLISRAAENPAAKNAYMGDVARVHVALRKKVPGEPKAPVQRQ